MIPHEVRDEALQAFADHMGTGWKLHENRSYCYAGRRFEYRTGARALLSAQPFRERPAHVKVYGEPIEAVTEWEAQVNVPFSAGPEVSQIGKLDPITEWVHAQEKVLELPFKMQECKSREAAEAMASQLSGDALVLLANVFDIHHTDCRRQTVQELARRCVPDSKGRW